MRKVNLNYVAPPARPWMGWALLVFALLITGWVVADFVRTRNQLTDTELALARLERNTARTQSDTSPSTIDRTQVEQAIRSASALVRSLRVPWEELFTAIENAQHESVAVLSIEPDVTSSTVRIVAEAKDEEAMVEYADLMQFAPGLTDVMLSNHQVQQQNPNKPVKFTLTANWIQP